MKFLRKEFDKVKPHFEKGGKWEKFYYAYEAFDTFVFSPNTVNDDKGAQIRDAIDLKRLMMTVIIAMVPCLLYGIWNVGHQHFLAIGNPGAAFGDKIWIGVIQVLPIVAVSYGVGLGVEFIFATIRRHPVNEGFLVTGMLIPLVMPPDVPLWQVALATIFAVIIGKEAFGGTGMNVLNVALTARAFLYFAYPSDISGDVWTYLGDATPVAGFSGATPLSIGASSLTTGENVVNSLNNFGTGWADGIFSFTNLFMGAMPGSIGETSVLMCLIGALILIMTGVGSWKIIVSVFAGSYIMAFGMNLIGVNEFMLMPAHYHLVIGGLAFGAVFMATDPVTASQTETGKWIYGFLIGVLTIIIRVFNPAYPEGVMLAILLMNVFAPLIDYYVVRSNKKEDYNVRQSNSYIIIFTLITTVFVGGTLALTSKLLGPRQALSIEYDTKSQILGAVMTLSDDDDVLGIYDKRIKSLVINSEGEEVQTDSKGQPLVAEKVDVAKNFKLDPEERLLPVFKYISESDSNMVEAYILPVYGNGLWNRVWAFMALDSKLVTIKGISFGHIGETPGLGARISDDPVIAERYKGKKIYNEQGEIVSVSMVKGEKGEPLDEHHVDGMSGATMTAVGVNKMLIEYLSCYESYFNKVKSQTVAGL